MLFGETRFTPPKVLAITDGVIRRLDPEDGGELFRSLVTSSAKLRGFSPWVPRVRSVPDAVEICRRERKRFDDHEGFTFGVFHPDGTLTGICGYWLTDGPLSHGQAEIGGWTRKGGGSPGMVFRAGRALIRWGFEQWPFERLEARCNTDNRLGMVLAERIGMRFEGVRRGVWDTALERRVDKATFGVLKTDLLSED